MDALVDVIRELGLIADKKNDNVCESLNCSRIAEKAIAYIKEQDGLIRKNKIDNDIILSENTRLKHFLHDKRMHGEWIETMSTKNIDNTEFSCPFCGYFDVQDSENTVLPNYCPFCGAMLERKTKRNDVP